MIPPHIHLENQSLNVTHLYLIPHQRKEKCKTPLSLHQSEVVYTSDTEEEDIYITASEDEDKPSDPRLEFYR